MVGTETPSEEEDRTVGRRALVAFGQSMEVLREAGVPLGLEKSPGDAK